jgi:tetratricopeptide (TPR) repeat protein
MLAAQMTASGELATSAIEIAELTGSARILASALITRATALENPEDIERGLALAEQTRDLRQLFRGLNNMAEALIRRGDLAETRPIYERFLHEAEQVGSTGQILWVRAQESSLRFVMGDWDDALATVDALLAEIESGTPHYMESELRETRTIIRHARGDTAGAIADAERALAVAREAKDPQTLVPALGNLADIYVHEGRVDLARAAVDEALAFARPLERHYYTEAVTLMWATYDQGLSAQAIEIFDRGADTDPWTAAVIAAWRGDLAATAGVFERFGARWPEAEIRMRIARRDGDQHELQRALAFFRSVGATRRIRDAEALLAATA